VRQRQGIDPSTLAKHVSVSGTSNQSSTKKKEEIKKDSMNLIGQAE
jgi:hypothetical protein